MPVEYGIFSDEGCVESSFYSVEEALVAVADRYTDEDDLTIEEMCSDHEGQPRNGCECCSEDDDEENSQSIEE